MKKANLIPQCEIIHLSRNGDNERIKIIAKIPERLGWIDDVRFVLYMEKRECRLEYVRSDDGEEITNRIAVFEGETELKLQDVYFYYLTFKAEGKNILLKKKNLTGVDSITREECFKIDIGMEQTHWAEGEVMYQIFGDRFARDNSVPMYEMVRRKRKGWDEKPSVTADEDGFWNVDFFGGNLRGIIAKLDYLASLRVKMIYLNPVVFSQSTHRYDTADYTKIDPYLGTNEDLKLLCDEAHKRGMKVILDAVFNHTGNDSIYYNEFGTFEELGAYQSTESKYFKFYKTKVDRTGKVSHKFWWGNKNMPVCDCNSKEWQEFICGVGGVIDQWFVLGIDGLRLDVADELTDEFIALIVEAVRRNKPDGFVIGEVWENGMRMCRNYMEYMDTVMNYYLIDGLLRFYKYKDHWKLDRVFNEILNEYSPHAQNTMMNFTSTHDMSRIITFFGLDNVYVPYKKWGWDYREVDPEWIMKHVLTPKQYEKGKRMLMSYVTVLAFLPGIFSIFYGDEVGMQGVGNLINRAPYPWGKEDKEIYEFFKSVIDVRMENNFLRTAKTRMLWADERIFMFERYCAEDHFLIVASRTSTEVLYYLPKRYEATEIMFRTSENATAEKLGAYDAVVLKIG